MTPTNRVPDHHTSTDAADAGAGVQWQLWSVGNETGGFRHNRFRRRGRDHRLGERLAEPPATGTSPGDEAAFGGDRVRRHFDLTS